MAHDTPLLSFASNLPRNRPSLKPTTLFIHIAYTRIRSTDWRIRGQTTVSFIVRVQFSLRSTYTYLCAITENGRGTLENKKVPFPICRTLPRCFAICIGLQCAACCFVSYAASYATCPGSHDNDSHIGYSSLVCRLTAVERDTVLRFLVYIMLV